MAISQSGLQLRRPIPSMRYRALAICGFAMCILLWALTSGARVVDPIFLPSPLTVASTGYDLIRDPVLWSDLWVSFLRVTVGFLLSAAFAIPIGILIGAFKPIEALVQPVTEFVRYIPVPLSYQF